MTVQRLTPGVYLQDPPTDGGHEILGAPTAIAVFIGWTRAGPVNRPTSILNWRDYQYAFEGLDGGDLGYAVASFYQNGGGQAWVIRVVGADGGAPGADELIGDLKARSGLQALEAVALFNLLCLPDLRTFPQDAHAAVAAAASDYCLNRRAMLLLDPPAGVADSLSVQDALDWIGDKVLREVGKAAINTAAYWPEPVIADPLNDPEPRAIAASGPMAGIFAATDSARGVWTAPAGVLSPFADVLGLSVQMTDDQNGQINDLGLNALRAFPIYGCVPWGARTLAGRGALASQWAYIPIRRTALYIENSLYLGLQWTAFEPNGPALWSRITEAVTVFMRSLSHQGAFVGSPAFWVVCDATTTSLDDIEAGVINLQVGYAQTEPAEYIVLSLQLTAQA